MPEPVATVLVLYPQSPDRSRLATHHNNSSFFLSSYSHAVQPGPVHWLDHYVLPGLHFLEPDTDGGVHIVPPESKWHASWYVAQELNVCL